jgi:hypothetical protein
MTGVEKPSNGLADLGAGGEAGETTRDGANYAANGGAEHGDDGAYRGPERRAINGPGGHADRTSQPAHDGACAPSAVAPGCVFHHVIIGPTAGAFGCFHGAPTSWCVL